MNESFDGRTPRSLVRPNVFQINLGAVANCTRQLRSHIGPGIYFFATLKANAYGYGLIPIARTVLNCGADAVSLANLDDAIRLRRAGVDAPILVFAGCLPSEQAVRNMEKFNLMPSIYSEECLTAFSRFSSRRLDVAVKVDVGLERIGIPAEQAAGFIQRVAAHKNLRVKVVHAHPSLRLGGRAGEYLEWQYQRFLRALEEVQRTGVDIPLKVFASSKVLKASGQSMLLSAVDPGAALFTPLTATSNEDDEEPFFSLKSRIIQVREVTRDQFLEEAPFKLTGKCASASFLSATAMGCTECIAAKCLCTASAPRSLVRQRSSIAGLTSPESLPPRSETRSSLLGDRVRKKFLRGRF